MRDVQDKGETRVNKTCRYAVLFIWKTKYYFYVQLMWGYSFYFCENSISIYN